MRQFVSLMALLLSAVLAAPAFAGEGHDHDAGVVPTARGPQRQADGSVFLPKPAQRQLAVVTTRAQLTSEPQAIALAGRVVFDPASAGEVQAAQDGRIEAPERGLLRTGSPVVAGQLLGWLVPITTALEQSQQQALIAALESELALARSRHERLQLLKDTVARKELETANADLQRLQRQLSASREALGQRQPLRAPVAGVLAGVEVIAGQVVTRGQPLFTVIDPQQQLIEALLYQPELASNLADATLTQGDELIALVALPRARQLREQALPLLFQAKGEAVAQLALGQPVAVLARTRTMVQGVALPASAVTRNTANQHSVWIKVAPEQFSPRLVTTVPLDGQRLMVTSGLTGGELVVVASANLINQVR